MKEHETKSLPTGQHAYNTRSRTFANTPGASSSSNPNNDNNNSQPNKQTQSGKQTQTTKITQHIQNAPKLDLQYDIIEDLKKTRANISMYNLLQIYPMPNSHVINPAMSSIILNAKQNVATNRSNDDSKATDKGKLTADKAFDVEQLQNVIRAITNEVVGLKKTNSENASFRGYFRNQFR